MAKCGCEDKDKRDYKPTERQVLFMTRWGIEYNSLTTRREVSSLIRSKLDSWKKDEMVAGDFLSMAV